MLLLWARDQSGCRQGYSCAASSHHSLTQPCHCRTCATQNEDFSSADAVFDCIGEAGEERINLAQLEQLLDAATVKA
jgi:hypothetical protein